MAPIVVLVSVLILLTMSSIQPVQGQGPLADHLREVYGEDWPHYAPWVHSEIKVADDVKAYNLRAVDLGYDLVPGVPARGVLVAYATSSKVGLAFVNRTGEFFRLCEVSVGSPPKYREGLDLGCINGKDGEKLVLIAWGSGNKLYLLRVKLGVYRLHEGANFPTVIELSNLVGIDLPEGYGDVKRVRVLALDDEFAVFFTARRENKPTEEYGYDLFYALVGPDGKLRLGPADLGFQDVMAFQVKSLKGASLIGLTVLGRWRQPNAGVWWVTARLEGNSLKVVRAVLVSDQDFEIPCVDRVLLDFAYYPIGNDEYSVLVVWNDCRCPKTVLEHIAQVVPGASFEYEKTKTWVVYGQRLIVGVDGRIEKRGGNFPAVYLALLNEVTTNTGVGTVISWNVTFAKIDSVTVYTAQGPDGNYFVIDASVDTANTLVSRWLSYARSGEFEERNTYGFDILSVPIPVDPDHPGVVGTEVDVLGASERASPGTIQRTEVWAAYPVFNESGSETLPENEPCPASFIYLYYTVQFSEVHAANTPAVMANQVNIKAVKLDDGVVVEGFVESTGDSGEKPGPLFVMPVVVVAGPVEDLYSGYDDLGYLHKYIYPLRPFTVLKFRPIRTEDHPSAQVGPVVYDLRSTQPSLPNVYLEVYYTTDFSDWVPPGPVLIDILGPSEPGEPVPGTPLSGYATVTDQGIQKSENVEVEMTASRGQTQVHVTFLPPAVEALERLTRTVAQGTVDARAVKEAAKDALNVLDRYLSQGLLRSPRGTPAELDAALRTLEELRDRAQNMKSAELVAKLSTVISNLRRLVEGTYHVFILYHPKGSIHPDKYDKEKAIGLKDLLDKLGLKPLLDELAYTGVTSWIPIGVTCEVPSVVPTETAPARAGEVETEEAPVVPPPTSEEQGGGKPNKEQSVPSPVKYREPRPTGSAPHPVPVLPVLPYRRGLSRPRLKSRSCTWRAR
ncbi:hypothetical protein [Methanopyrus sp.]